MKIVVIGGTGLIGRPLVEELRALGHEVVAVSPSGTDASTGESLDQTLAGARVVVDVANWPSYEDAIARTEAQARGLDQASCDLMIDSFLRHGRNRLKAEMDAGIGHHVAMTLVGAHRMPDSPYMRAKVALEELVENAGLPYTIVRTTQFFEAIRETADLASEGGAVVRVPSVDLQPIAAKDVAHAICEVAISEPAHGFVEIAGPDRIKFHHLVRRVLDAHSDPREVVGEAQARYFGTEMTDASMTPGPEARLGQTSFGEWLAGLTSTSVPGPRIDFANFPAPAEGIAVTLFITVRKVERSRDFYSRVLGGTVVLDENPCIVKLANSWILMNPGGPPTPDKPGISVVDYEPGNTTSIYLNLRVADIQACYQEWKAKGAEFVTPPIDRGAEIRCYMRDPDGYLIEVGQATGVLQGQLASKRAEDLPG